MKPDLESEDWFVNFRNVSFLDNSVTHIISAGGSRVAISNMVYARNLATDLQGRRIHSSIQHTSG